MKIYVINLKRRPDRLDTFKTNCPYKDVNIIEAFDGKHIESNIENKKLFYRIRNHTYSKNLSDREIGCFVSHMSLWKTIIDKKDKYNLIFEDDPIFSDNFKDKLDSINLDKYIENIMYVGGRFTPNFIMDKKYYINITDDIIKHNTNIEWNYEQQCRGAFAYIITNQFAEMLYYSFDIIFNGIALDHYIIDCLNHYKLEIINTNPLLCHSPACSEDSDIRQTNWVKY
jgi:GR25 family glycosyltransferase involved in LPS biosynthesis